MRVTGERPLATSTENWHLSQYPTYSLLRTDVPSDDKLSAPVKNVVFSQAIPTPLEDAHLVCVSQDALLNLLDLHLDVVDDPSFTALVAGKELPKGARPVAHRYGGYQFGVWAGQLGDGRAHILGEYLNRHGERWQLQLKGSGRTPYSRERDGRTLLRSAIREMIASEACHAMGIPTTRAAAMVASEKRVSRSPPNTMEVSERTGSLLRLAPCWFRFGSLEMLARSGEFSVLRHLCDFIIKEYYRFIMLSDENRYVRLFSEIAERSLDLVAKWQAFGFTHGLLNTDNMSVLGITLDFGPFTFLDCYDGGFVANSSDAGGRYAFNKQPDVVLWNLGQLGNSLRPLMNTAQQTHLANVMGALEIYLKNRITERFLPKLGLVQERYGDEHLMEKFLDIMQSTGADFTATFRQLAELDPSELLNCTSLEQAWSIKRLASHAAWPLWVESYRERLLKEAGDAINQGVGTGAYTRLSGTWEEERRRRMCRVNPVYVPRNWMMQEAIQDAERNNFDKVKFLMEVFRNPYEVQPEAENLGFSSPPPLWAHSLSINCTS